MPRTLTVTFNVDIDHLPASEIDDIEEVATDENMTVDEAAACVLSEAEEREVGQALMTGLFDEVFAGSCLYLKVVDARLFSAKWDDAVASSINRCTWPKCDQPSGGDYCYDHCLADRGAASAVTSTEGK